MNTILSHNFHLITKRKCKRKRQIWVKLEWKTSCYFIIALHGILFSLFQSKSFFFQLLEIIINFFWQEGIIYCHKSTCAPLVSQHVLLQQSIGCACRNPTRCNFEVSIQIIRLSVGKGSTVTTCLETSSSLRLEVRTRLNANFYWSFWSSNKLTCSLLLDII